MIETLLSLSFAEAVLLLAITACLIWAVVSVRRGDYSTPVLILLALLIILIVPRGIGRDVLMFLYINWVKLFSVNLVIMVVYPFFEWILCLNSYVNLLEKYKAEVRDGYNRALGAGEIDTAEQGLAALIVARAELEMDIDGGDKDFLFTAGRRISHLANESGLIVYPNTKTGDYYPKFSNNISTIAQWAVFWPLFLLNRIFGDLIIRLTDFVVKCFARTYDSISSSMTKRI